MKPKHTNPFTATLGATPPLLVGRSDAIDDFGFALDEGPGAHERISLIIGPRGIGKTVLLNAFEDEALARGWLTLSDTATTGFVERFRSSIIQRLSQDRKQLKGLNVSILGISGGPNWDTRAIAESTYSLRNALKDLLAYKRELDRKARQEPGGVLVTLDEMHHQRSQELIEFGATIQHLIREGEDISVVMAGIPSSIRPLLSGKLNSHGDANPVTFLRRANRIELGRVSDSDVREALEEPLHSAATSWSQDALKTAVEACHGYPFMIQLVGQCSFREKERISDDGSEISIDSAQRAVATAQRKLGQLVHEPALSDLSNVDRSFLVYMAQNDGPTKISDIKARFNKTDSYVGNYRRRLLDAEMITTTGHGEVDFALPYMRDYLREHAASLIVEDFDSQ